MSSKTNNMGTYTLTSSGGPNNDGVYTINQADGVYIIAFKMADGSEANVSGSAKIGDFGDSTPIDLVALENTVFSNPDPIDGLVITVVSGEVLAITNQ